MSNITIERFEKESALEGRLFEILCGAATKPIVQLAISGGSILKHLAVIQTFHYPLSPNTKWRLLLADERCVPATSPESNYRGLISALSAGEGVLETVQIIWAEPRAEETATETAARFEELLSASKYDQTQLDLVLLGLGEDGHICSLFPGKRVSNRDRTRFYIGVEDSPKPPSKRVTLSLHALSLSHQIIVVAASAPKKAALDALIAGTSQSPLLQLPRTISIKILTTL